MAYGNQQQLYQHQRRRNIEKHENNGVATIINGNINAENGISVATAAHRRKKKKNIAAGGGVVALLAAAAYHQRQQAAKA